MITIPPLNSTPKGVGRYFKIGKKKGGTKAYVNTYVNEGAFLDTCPILVVINDSPTSCLLNHVRGDTAVSDRVHTDHVKPEESIWREATHAIKTKKNSAPDMASVITHTYLEGPTERCA